MNGEKAEESYEDWVRGLAPEAPSWAHEQLGETLQSYADQVRQLKAENAQLKQRLEIDLKDDLAEKEQEIGLYRADAIRIRELCPPEEHEELHETVERVITQLRENPETPAGYVLLSKLAYHAYRDGGRALGEKVRELEASQRAAVIQELERWASVAEREFPLREHALEQAVLSAFANKLRLRVRELQGV